MESDKMTGIMDKLESKAGMIGGALGLMQAPMADGRGIAGAMGYMQARITAWHIPDPMRIWSLEMEFPHEFPIVQNIMTTIGGWVLSQFGSVVDSRLSQAGRIIKKGGLAMLIANIVSGFIWMAALNPGGASGGAGVHSQSASMSFAPGGPGTPHTTSHDGYTRKLAVETVVA